MANISAYSYKSWETSFGNGMAADLKSELDHYEKLLYRLLYHTAQKEQMSFSFDKQRKFIDEGKKDTNSGILKARRQNLC